MPDVYLPEDEIPDSLVAVLREIAVDFVPETIAAAETINQWLEQQTPEAGEIAERMVGMAEFSCDGVQINAIAQPYRFFLLQRVQDACDDLPDDVREKVESLFAAANMSTILEQKLTRRLGRENNREVWV